MAGLNKVLLIGHLGRDPEVRRTAAGAAVVTFSIATSESWKDKTTGERHERTEWHNVVIFNESLGKVAEQYLKKGSKAFIEGQLKTREYTDKDGAQRRVTEIVLSQYNGMLVLLDRIERPVQEESSYGKTTLKSSIGYGARRDDVDGARASDGGSAVLGPNDDIPF